MFVKLPALNFGDLNARSIKKFKRRFECYLEANKLLLLTATPAKQWAGVMAPYVAYCFGFNMRMKELRLGHHGYSVSSRAGNEEKTPDGLGRVSKFGLEPRHHVLLEGCTFPPEIQSSMAQTPGSMTVCIKLASHQHFFRNLYEEVRGRY